MSCTRFAARFENLVLMSAVKVSSNNSEKLVEI